VRRGADGASAKSSVKLMLLSVKEGDEIVIRAQGDDAEAAVEALARFVEGDGPAAPAVAPAAAPPAAPERPGRGIPVSEGAALGPTFPFFPEPPPSERRAVAPGEREAEVARFRAALAETIAALRAGAAQDTSDGGDIAEALAEVAGDEELAGAIEDTIRSGADAVSATLDAGAALSARFEAMEDAYLRARAEDVRGVTRALAGALAGRPVPTLASVPEGAIVVADEISAVDLARAPLERIGGLLCRLGAATSHAAIVARTHGIPAVMGYADDPARLRQARIVALDGGSGEVVVDPDEEMAAAFARRIGEERARRADLERLRLVEPSTRDGRRVEIAANLGSVKDIAPALRAGAMGVGLFRTELLFMESRAPPSEEAQARVYARLALAFAPHRVIVRTLDVGGDKPVPGIDFPHEHNPFLGWRGIRMCLDRPDIFEPQLRALLRAATHGNIAIMLPMVADIEELRRAKGMLAACRAELAARGVPAGDPPLGVMIETPAAALMADELAREAAFFSIGTNDLAQYVTAADRLDPRLARLARADHPAVLRAAELACRAARAAGIRVGVCGEAAARPDLIGRFLAMGVTELSMSPAAIPRAKQRVMEL
jgi:phosphocarrier protein FPr